MQIERGMVLDVNLDPPRGSETGKVRACIVVTNDAYNRRVPVIQVVPIAAWSERKARIVTNVELQPSAVNGLTKAAIADCLQTRPIDHRVRDARPRGRLDATDLGRIDQALKQVFSLR